MAKTLQKKIKFSKGQITPNLQERTDLEIYDSSASVLENVDVTLYGGVKGRNGTARVKEIKAYSPSQSMDYTPTSYIGGTVADLKNDNTFISGGTGGASTYLELDLGEIKTDFLFKINGICFDYQNCFIYLDSVRQPETVYPEIYMRVVNTSIQFQGVGINNLTPSASGTITDIVVLNNTLSLTTDNAGKVTAINGDYYYKFTWTKPHYNAWDGKNTLACSSVHTQPNSTDITIESSDDGVTWIQEDSATINETKSYIQTQIASARYIRIKPSTDVNSRLKIDNIECLASGTEETVGEIKLVDFIYNNIEKYLFMLLKGRVDIYKFVYGTPTYIDSVNVPVLTDEIIEGIKWTYKDDTIIFTHQDMPPQKLIRLSDNNWDWQQITLQDVPKELFGTATVTAKTVTLTPDKAEGIVTLTAGSAVFDVNYEGQIIDGNGGRVRVTKYISTTKVSGYTIIPFYNTDSFSSWNYESGYETVWSATKGYPRCCCIANERLFFAGTPTKPNTIWASRVADYFNFKNAGNYDNDSISFTMDTNAVIYDMIFNRGLHIFTSDFEASSPESSFKPSSFKVVPTTKNGIYPYVRPIVADGQIMYIDSTGNNLLTYTYNDNINSYESKNLSKLTNIIQSPTSISTLKDNNGITRVFITNYNNPMAVITISLEDEIFAPSIYTYSIDDTDDFFQVCVVGNTVNIIRRINENYPVFYRYYYEYMNNDIEKIDGGRTVNVVNYKVYENIEFNRKFYYTFNGKEYESKFINGEATVEKDSGQLYIYEKINHKIKGNIIAVNNRTDTKKRIAKATVVCKGHEITFCGQTKKITNSYQPVDFYACTLYGKDITYNIEGTENLDILSIELNINYEG